MKYLPLIILTFLLSLTWNMVQSDQSVSEIIHAEIQEDLQKMISDHIFTKLPHVKNINFSNIWTETINDNQIKAHFKYNFDEENEVVGKSGNLIDGFAILNKSDKNDEGATIWTVEEIQILNNHITFEEGMILSPGDDDE